jgi:hypothetical protein
MLSIPVAWTKPHACARREKINQALPAQDNLISTKDFAGAGCRIEWFKRRCFTTCRQPSRPHPFSAECADDTERQHPAAARISTQPDRLGGFPVSTLTTKLPRLLAGSARKSRADPRAGGQ